MFSIIHQLHSRKTFLKLSLSLLFHQFLQLKMAIQNSNSFEPKAIISYLLILSLTITFATAGRILDEEVATPTVAPENPDPTDQAPVSGATTAGAAVGVTGIELCNHLI